MKTNTLDQQHFEVVIIGAGMAGMAAGIRLALAGKNVVILEKHNASGGLNSFYSIEGRKYDVGLHAMTNFVPKGTKGTPLTKLLRQLRIPYDALDLCQQNGSRIAFPAASYNSATISPYLKLKSPAPSPSRSTASAPSPKKCAPSTPLTSAPSPPPRAQPCSAIFPIPCSKI